MNLSEHPLALDLQKRISASDERAIPVLIFMPAMGRLEGLLRQSDTPGCFILASQVEIQGQGMQGVMDFAFTADKPIVIIHPNSTQAQPESRIIS
jgi:hypothetical protein